MGFSSVCTRSKLSTCCIVWTAFLRLPRHVQDRTRILLWLLHEPAPDALQPMLGSDLLSARAQFTKGSSSPTAKTISSWLTCSDSASTAITNWCLHTQPSLSCVPGRHGHAGLVLQRPQREPEGIRARAAGRAQDQRSALDLHVLRQTAGLQNLGVAVSGQWVKLHTALRKYRRGTLG